MIFDPATQYGRVYRFNREEDQIKAMDKAVADVAGFIPMELMSKCKSFLLTIENSLDGIGSFAWKYTP